MGHDAYVAGRTNPLRAIPSVERLLRHPDAVALVARCRRERVVEALRMVLADTRRSLAGGGVLPSDAALVAAATSLLDAGTAPRPTRVVNATGVVLHTNLGRALLAEDAIAAMADAARGAMNLELDLVTGRRGDRDALLADDLCALTGAEAGLVVNNNAAAVLLAIAALAGGREVVVSRGELVEIGGSFRMPEVMAVSGARLREVGTTNRTHADDYRKAIGPETGLLVKVHTSNYRIVGFTADVDLRDLVAIGRARGVPVLDDLGSGALVDLAALGLPSEPVVRDRVAAGADLVSFSGDKLLGDRKRGSSSAGAISSSSSRRTRCAVRSGPTRFVWRGSPRRCGCTGIHPICPRRCRPCAGSRGRSPRWTRSAASLRRGSPRGSARAIA